MLDPRHRLRDPAAPSQCLTILTRHSPVINPRLAWLGAAVSRTDHPHQPPGPGDQVPRHQRPPGVPDTGVPAPGLVTSAHLVTVDPDIDPGIPENTNYVTTF